MRLSKHRRLGKVWQLGLLLALVLWVSASGCGQKKTGNDVSAKHSGSDTGTGQPEQVSSAPDPRWHQAFGDATISEPPIEWFRPPDTTVTHKSVGKLYTEVVKAWDDIKFSSPAGKRINYKAVLDTDMGPIEIALRPELAPNHVRSFVALAKAEYYDGLCFDRTIRQEVEGSADRVEYIEAGCPLGTGESGFGSIGYWLKPEFSAQPTHEEGTVGASHGEQSDAAACKFYISLGKAPVMDGNFTIFGKVTQGIEVVRKISSLPVKNDPEFPEGDRPVKPIVIRKVTIHTEEVNPPPTN